MNKKDYVSLLIVVFCLGFLIGMFTAERDIEKTMAVIEADIERLSKEAQELDETCRAKFDATPIPPEIKAEWFIENHCPNWKLIVSEGDYILQLQGKDLSKVSTIGEFNGLFEQETKTISCELEPIFLK